LAIVLSILTAMAYVLILLNYVGKEAQYLIIA